MRKLKIALFIVAGVVVVGLIAKDIILKAAVEKGVGIVTGLKLNMRSLHVGILKPVVAIKELSLFNPPGFVDKTMIEMPEIYVDYDLPAIIGGKIHLSEVRLALKEFYVVKNAKGELNLDALKTVQAQKKGEPAKTQKPKAEGKAPGFQIDKLVLSIGKVVYKDYSKGSAPSVKEYQVNLHETYTNVDDPSKLASLIVVKALMGTPIAALSNFDIKGLSGSLGTMENAAKQVTGNVKGALGQVFDLGK